MKLLVVSDFHLGRGPFLKNGQTNILEDFEEDERFAEFVNYYSTGKNYLSRVHLILNGDILNLIQVDIEGVFNHIVDEEVTIKALSLVAEGHPLFFEALKDFLGRPNKKITYVIGNHDAAMAFEGAQQAFRSLVEGDVDFCFDLNISGIHIEHGQRFEVNNATPMNQYFLDGPNGKRILNLPWGSLFCISLLPKLKKDRPYIDRVRPMSLYLKWCLLHEPFFYLHLVTLVLKYFIVTNFATYTKINRNFKTTLKLLKQITMYPRYARKAKLLLNENKNIKMIIMGHTHILEWRKFPERKYYFNTGTWNPIPSLDASLYESYTKLSYVSVNFNLKTGVIKDASLKEWKGKWKPFRDEVHMAI